MQEAQKQLKAIEDTERSIDHKDLWYELKFIRDNHLKHMKDDIDDLKSVTKENRSYFDQKLDKLDARIWSIVIMSGTTLLGIIATYLLK